MKISSVLLLGAENILALTVIRTLGSVLPEAKIHTLSPNNRKKPATSHSKFIDSTHYFNSWDDDDLFNLLQKKIRETGADLILPVTDESVRVLATWKDKLNDVYLPPLPAIEVYDLLERKDLLAEFLNTNKFDNAETLRLGETDIQRMKPDQFPVMLKPISGSSGVGINKYCNKYSLAKTVANIEKNNYILQEYIPGVDFGCSILAVDGKIKAHTIQKVLANKNFGVATAIQFTHHEQILAYTKRLLKYTGYSGVAHLDFRLDDRDGKAKLIDFNARFWASLQGSCAAGINFVFLSCLSAAGIPFIQPEYNHITYYIGTNTILYYLKKALHLKKALIPQQQVYTDFRHRISDPLPEIARYIK
ncbi:MAG: ATP-grasp domain-containing protein [Balneolaceae bacterium]